MEKQRSWKSNERLHMRPESRYLFDSLKYGKTDLPELWEKLTVVMTLAPGTQRETLWKLLEELRGNLLVEFPKSERLWDRCAQPHLPEWIKKPRLKNKKWHVDGIIWSPELSFLAGKAAVRPDSPWLAVDAWLKRTRVEKPALKPVRERSLDIFGDEKELDSLLRQLPFKNGLVTLETLGCFYVPEPIPWLPGPIGSECKPGLCVENATTYYTMCRFNKEVGFWGYVAYGRGNGFVSMSEGVQAVVESYGHNQLLYFGDADLEGVEIAAKGAKRLIESGVSVGLDSRLYDILITSGTEATSKSGGELSDAAARLIADAGLGTLPDIFRRHMRIAQEWAGLETLRSVLTPLPLD